MSSDSLLRLVDFLTRQGMSDQDHARRSDRRDSFLDTHVIVRRDQCAAMMERRPSGLWGAAVEIRDDRIIPQWSRERGWIEEPARPSAP
jgi:hypothetical protein